MLLKSIILSASVSIISLSEYPSSTAKASIDLSFLEALDAVPTIDSPGVNDPETVETSNTLVMTFQDLTLAVVPLVEPVTISLKTKVPTPTICGGFAIVIIGDVVYPNPAFVILIWVIVPAALTIAVAAAETVEIPVNVIVGMPTYPPPPFVIVIIPTTPSPIVDVAAALTPSPIKNTWLPNEYPRPRIITSTH